MQSNISPPRLGVKEFCTNKHDSNKRDHSLLPTSALNAMTDVLKYGANKYGADNWRLGIEWSRYYSAALRHLLAWNDGEDNDKESNLNHLAHALCNIAFLIHYQEYNMGTDDRSKTRFTITET